MHNHITGTMKTEHVGCARVEQVGSSKVTHVGANHSTRVGYDHGTSAGRNITIGAGQNWSLAAGDTIAMVAKQNVNLHAGRGIGIISDNEMYQAALNGIVLTSKKVCINAEDEIILGVGDANSISIRSDGTVAISAAKTIVIDAGEKVTLQSSGASLNVGGGQVLSNPPVEDGGSDEKKDEADAPAAAQKMAENLIKKGTNWRQWLATAGGMGAKWAEERLHFYAKGKKLVEEKYDEYFPKDATAKPSDQKPLSSSDPLPPGYVDDGHGGASYDPSRDPTIGKTP